MNRHHLLLVPALALGAALAGCDRGEDDRTAAQRGERDIVSAERRTEDARADAGRTAEQAQQRAEDVAARAADVMSDAAITAEVTAALAGDPALSALRIDVDTKSGVVRLSGPAPSEQARERATELASAARGVVRVDNRLSVQ